MGCCNSKSPPTPQEKEVLTTPRENSPPTPQEKEVLTTPRENPPPSNPKHSHKIPQIQTPPPFNSPQVHDPYASSWSQSPTHSIHTPSDAEYFQESNSSTNNIINVLLLGESGVGKSTFINALVNYLTFDTLEQAHQKKPVALMPVSFLMTEGDNFEERTVRFGDKDPNEIHNQSGQSVTQRCKSYLFSIGTRRKLNLIDTPGMCDTRGLDQDHLNMQHILSFINNLSHLTAICILLKPNESKLNVVFRSCFNQLLSFLGENVRKNIIFCFTNTRTTFFTPGDTAPLLKQMLSNLSIDNIPFEKSNTFCFDSESFRYLIARENGIKFNDQQKKEYKDSWISSVNESNRFLQYICSELKSYPQINWRSIEHAQFRIHRMIRPILETIRNILRNIILINKHSSEPQIQLRLTSVSSSSTICSKCKRIPQQFSDFWILTDELHYIHLDKCTRCTCNRKKHIDVNYRLDYDLLDGANGQSIDPLVKILEQLKLTSVEFGYCFLWNSQTRESNDPIFDFLNQIIDEEKEICQDKGSQCLNLELLKKLNQFKDEYEQRRSGLMSRRNSIDLTNIYELIQNVNGMNLIRKQMN